MTSQKDHEEFLREERAAIDTQLHTVTTVLTIVHDETLVTADFLGDHVLECEGVQTVDITEREA